MMNIEWIFLGVIVVAVGFAVKGAYQAYKNKKAGPDGGGKRGTQPRRTIEK